MALLDFVYVIALLTAIVSVAFFFIAWSNPASENQRRKAPSMIALLFPISIAVAWIASLTSTSIAQSKAREFLDSLSRSNNYAVSIDGNVAANQQEVLNALKQFEDMPAHHSHPTRELQIEISDPPRRMRIWLGRDSDDPREYWVFTPSPSKFAARASLKTDIGHIKTSVFDAY